MANYMLVNNDSQPHEIPEIGVSLQGKGKIHLNAFQLEWLNKNGERYEWAALHLVVTEKSKSSKKADSSGLAKLKEKVGFSKLARKKGL